MEMVLKFSSRDLEQRGPRASLYKAFSQAGEQQIVSIMVLSTLLHYNQWRKLRVPLRQLELC